MKPVHYVFIIGLIAAVFLVEYDLSKRVDTAKLNPANKAATSAKNNPALLNAPAIAVTDQNNKPVGKSFTAQFKEEAEQIGKLQADPETAQARMRALAAKMNQQDVEDMYEVISDDRNNGDQRALAVELLSIKNDTASLIALQNFVANNTTVNGTKWDRKKEFETVLRAQAVESIAAYPQKDIALSTLSFLQSKVDESFLVDRINRAAANLSGKASPLNQQDEAALKQLVE